ncbi:hypothetical protein QR77_00710 [Streptomyces sp. 150FB]|uniref:ABC transporter ATP-binding protein n=1 Tax=Streptomyces sp. 150FB TaxID=1576605 RepID=UPI0005891561|nr:ABC transporter ATP-binding protein [Streptomyces sp. 150FB]KIF72928.1 hypothetical protein QR77_00710 [Streptomyces sp. 150FB]
MSALEFRSVSVRYGDAVVVDSIDLVVPHGKIVGLVGESGSGKSSLAQAAVGMVPLAGGSIFLDGVETRKRKRFGSLQMVFQDPFGSLDPRMRIGRSISEAIPKEPGTGAAARRGEVERLLELVGIDPELSGVLPSQMSGGQLQRVGIARALASKPDVIIADEITSALDASIQGAVLNLLRELQRSLGLSMLFISHNMAVVRYVSDIVAVMHEGAIVEQGPADRLLDHATHPYTRELLAAARLEL